MESEKLTALDRYALWGDCDLEDSGQKAMRIIDDAAVQIAELEESFQDVMRSVAAATARADVAERDRSVFDDQAQEVCRNLERALQERDAATARADAAERAYKEHAEESQRRGYTLQRAEAQAAARAEAAETDRRRLARAVDDALDGKRKAEARADAAEHPSEPTHEEDKQRVEYWREACQTAESEAASLREKLRERTQRYEIRIVDLESRLATATAMLRTVFTPEYVDKELCIPLPSEHAESEAAALCTELTKLRAVLTELGIELVE